MKSTILLTIALFLISAPAPDANDIAEMTANFIVPKQLPGLEAAEVSPRIPGNSNTSVPTPEKPVNTDSSKMSTEDLSFSAVESVQSTKDTMHNRPANGG